MVRVYCIRYAIVSFLSLALAACAPTAAAQETRPAVTQTIVATETEIASATPENTPTATATATPENTPTPKFTATPEEMTQEQIRAEILAAGVNLDDLASSTNEWASSHKAIDSIQNSIDNLNFGSEAHGSVTMVVIGLEYVKNFEQLDQALLTDGGWKLTTFAKLAYKDVEGNWQIIKLPLNAYHPEDDLIWIKYVSTRSGSFLVDASEKNIFRLDDEGNFDVPFRNFWTMGANNVNYHWDTGSFFKLFTGWTENPRWANNDAVLGDPPRYSEQDLIEFRKTGDPSIFGYKDSDGYDVYWPIVTFNADLSDRSNYDQE